MPFSPRVPANLSAEWHSAFRLLKLCCRLGGSPSGDDGLGRNLCVPITSWRTALTPATGLHPQLKRSSGKSEPGPRQRSPGAERRPPAFHPVRCRLDDHWTIGPRAPGHRTTEPSGYRTIGLPGARSSDHRAIGDRASGHRPPSHQATKPPSHRPSDHRAPSHRTIRARAAGPVAGSPDRMGRNRARQAVVGPVLAALVKHNALFAAHLPRPCHRDFAAISTVRASGYGDPMDVFGLGENCCLWLTRHRGYRENQ